MKHIKPPEPHPHFQRSKDGTVPCALKKYLYSHCPDTDTLQYHTLHQQGSPVSSLDLRYWSNIQEALNGYKLDGFQLKDINVSDNDEVDDKFVFNLRAFADSLESINLSSCSLLTEVGLGYICALSKLQHLNLKGVSVLQDSDVESFASQLPHLSGLDVSNCPDITDTALFAISNSAFCDVLTTFKCSNNSNVTHVGVKRVLFECLKLDDLDVSSCTSLTFVGIVITADSTYGFSEKPMKQYVTRSIRHLDVSGCPLLTDSLDWIGAALPDLETVDLSAIPQVENGFVQGLALGSPHLKRINIRNCKQVDSSSVVLIAGCQCRRTLVHLDISYLGTRKLESVAVRRVLEYCVVLESLDISGNAGLTDDMFCNGLDLPAGESRLKRLLMHNCALVTSTGVAMMATSHTSLEELTISGLSRIDNAALAALGSHCHNLKILRANDCLGLGEEGIERLCEGCPGLLELHIGTVVGNTDAWGGRVQQYTDNTLKAIFMYLRRLRVLDIRNQCGITMTSSWLRGGRGEASDFAGHLFLKRLDLLGADKLSIPGMAAVLSKCFALEHVTLPRGPADSGVELNDKGNEEQHSQDDETVSSRGSGVSTPTGRNSTDSRRTSRLSTAASLFKRQNSSMSSGASVTLRNLVKSANLENPKTFWHAVFGRSCYSTHSTILDGKTYEWGGLFPHSKRDIWAYRDSFIRRQMDEQWAARKIQFVYRKAVSYRELKLVNTTKYLQRWYRYKRREYKLSLIRDRLYIIDCATRIQRKFRENLLPLLRSIVLVQRIVRGWKGRTTFVRIKSMNDSAKKIQKIARGMIVRLSDRYILAQIYMKLPPFWKTVIHSCAPEEGDDLMASLGSFSTRGEYQERVKAYQIARKKKEVQDMIKGIEANRTNVPDIEYASSGAVAKFDLAPKLPFIVPQAFDKKPYVSRADGRKLAFFSDPPALLRSDVVIKGAAQSMYASQAALTFGLENISRDSEQKKVHQYTFTFWPIEPHREEPASDTTLFDPMLNGFEVRQNMKRTLHCELCGLRLRLIFCKVCVKGYCFFCAFKAHVDGSKRNHHMDMIEPRVVHVKESNTSLIYHMDMVQKATYDIKYLVGFLKSSAEIQRIQKERNLAKEMEQLAAKKAIEAAKAAEESAQKHNAATKIANCYRQLVARKYVRAKANQRKLEDVSFRCDNAHRAAVVIQRRYRVYSVRLYFQKKVGIKFRVDFKKKKKKYIKKSAKEEARRLAIRKAAVEKRVLYDVQQRRVNARNKLFSDIFEEYCQAIQMIEANNTHWLELIQKFPKMEEKLREQRKAFKQEHRKNEIILQAGMNSLEPKELFHLNAKVKSLFLKRGACTHRIEHINSTKWWLTHHIRGNCRRLAVIKERFKDTIDRVKWLTDEDFVMERLCEHLKLRIELVENDKDLGFAGDWMKEYMDYAEKFRAKLDAMQETVLTEELRRIVADQASFKATDSLMSELMNAMKMDSQYAVERVYLDSRSFYVTAGSDESVSISDRALALKLKQQRIAESVLDQVKMGLDARFEEDENKYVDIAAFPTDSTDLEPEDMPSTITAVLVDRHVPKKHFELKAFVDVLYSQPWMAKQALADVHLEETLRTKELNLDKLESNVTSLEREIDICKSDIAAAEKKINEIGVEVSVLETEVEEDHDPDVWEDIQNNIELLNHERSRLNAEVRLKLSNVEKHTDLLPTLKDRVEVLNMQFMKMKDALETRNSQRKVLLNKYFQLEEKLSSELSLSMIDMIKAVVVKLSSLREKCRLTETAVLRDVPEQLLNCVTDFETEVLLSESNKLPRFQLQDCVANVSKNLNCGGIRLAELSIEVSTAVAESIVKHFEFREEVHNKEEAIFASFQANKAHHQERMEMFLNSQLNMRRQHALQRELDERKARLREMRDIRMAAIKQVREIAKEEERKRQEEEEKKAKIEKKTITAIVADKMKRGVRSAADEYRKMKERRENGLDKEEERMAGYMRKKKTTGGVEGIRKIKITASQEELEVFQRQNDVLFSKGLPYYRMMERGIGTKGDVFLWFEMSSNPEDFITHMELGHTDPSNPLYKELDRIGFERVANPLIKMVIFVKRDKRKDTAINAVRVSYEQSEENRFRVDGYERVSDGVSLSEFDLPDIYLWIHKIDKDDKPEAANTNALIGELRNARKMLKNRPDDQELIKLVNKLEEKLGAAYENEKEAEVTDPIEYAVDLLALSNSELSKWMKVFHKVDKKRTTRITTDDLFEWLGEPPTKFNMYILQSLDSLGTDSTLEFGDFLRTFAVFCMFGADEILRLCFTFADSEHEGLVSHADFIRLLNQLHPFDKTRTKRALAELDLSPTKKMTWEEFKVINGILPTLMYPAFRLQYTMREKSMGEDWWLRKLRKYKGVREKLKGSKTNADEAAEREMARVAHDDMREKRMKERASRIAQSGSAIEKVILNARQLADEFS